jgi:uncharacterized membrane protein YdjX (TVP38/TMEM64 family)
MLKTLQDWIALVLSEKFWLDILANFHSYGPVAPIFLAMLESFIPALPLIAIVTFTIGAYGPVFGFIYAYIGSLTGSILVFLLFRRVVKPYFMHLVPQRKNLGKLMDWVSGQLVGFRRTALYPLHRVRQTDHDRLIGAFREFARLCV